MEYNNPNFKSHIMVNEKIINRYLNPYGEQKAFEAEDAKELKIFDDMLKKVGKGEKIELKFQRKILSLTERLQNKFNNILRICKNRMSANALKSYIETVIHMENIIIKKINIGFGSKEDKTLVVYLRKWLKEKIDQLEQVQGKFRDRFESIKWECATKKSLRSLNVDMLKSYIENVISMRNMVVKQNDMDLGKPDDKDFISSLNYWIKENQDYLKKLGGTPYKEEIKSEYNKENKSIYYGKKVKSAINHASSLNSYYIPTIWESISKKDDYYYRKAVKDEQFTEKPIKIIKDTIDEKEDLKLDDRKEEPIEQFKHENENERYSLVDSASADQKKQELSKVKNEQNKLLERFSSLEFEYDPKYGKDAFNDLKKEITSCIDKLNGIKDLSFVNGEYKGKVFDKLINSLKKIVNSNFPPTERVCGTFDCLENIFDHKTEDFKGRKRLKRKFRELYDDAKKQGIEATFDPDDIGYIRDLPFYKEFIESKNGESSDDENSESALKYSGLCEFVDCSMVIVNCLLKYIQFSKYAKSFENNSEKFEEIKSYLSKKNKNDNITLEKKDKKKIESFRSFLKDKFSTKFLKDKDKLEDPFLGSTLSDELSNYEYKEEHYLTIDEKNRRRSDFFELVKKECNEILNSDNIDKLNFEEFMHKITTSIELDFVDTYDKKDPDLKRRELWESLNKSLNRYQKTNIGQKYCRLKFPEHIRYIEDLLLSLDKVIKTINPKESKLEEFRFKNGQIIKEILEKLDNYLTRHFSTDYQNDKEIKELKSKCLKVLESKKFSNNDIQSLLENIQTYLCSDAFLYYNIPNGKIEKFKKSIGERKLWSELIGRTKVYGEIKEYKDLAYKMRRIIDDWTSLLNELIESLDPKKSKIDELKRKKAIICKTMLEKLDDYLIRYQNETEDKRYFQPGFNKLEKPDTNGQMVNTNIEVEKRMWNIKDKKPYFSDRDVIQGNMGDCWLESTLKSLASNDKDKLLKVFPNYSKEVSPIDGSFSKPRITVRLYDYNKNKYTNRVSITGEFKDISVDTTELTTDNPKGKNGSAWNKGKVLWPHMIEKAVDKFFQEYHYNDKNDYGHQIDGNTLLMAQLILTGKNPEYFDINNKEFENNKNDENKKIKYLNDLLKTIKTSKGKGNITCGTRDNFYDLNYGLGSGYQVLKDKDLGIRVLNHSHAYTFVGFDENKKDISKTKIYLKNPHNKKENDEILTKRIGKGKKVTGFDELTLYLEEFAEYFSDICYI